MARYIDVEALKNDGHHCWHDGEGNIYYEVDHAPTADVVEVVRCEKCRYFFDERCNHPKNRVVHRVPDFGNHYMYVEGIKVESNHYCGYGERSDT